MKKHDAVKNLQELWERAEEVAIAGHQRTDDLDTVELERVMGFSVRSSVKAGAQGGMPTYLKSLCTGKCQSCG